jgi:hypothetical protein
LPPNCRLESKVSLGVVEGLNNKIRVIQRRAYGLRDEDYLRLLPPAPWRPSQELQEGAESRNSFRRFLQFVQFLQVFKHLRVDLPPL